MEFAHDDGGAPGGCARPGPLLAETPRAAEAVDDLVEAVAERTAAGDARGGRGPGIPWRSRTSRWAGCSTRPRWPRRRWPRCADQGELRPDDRCRLPAVDDLPAARCSPTRRSPSWRPSRRNLDRPDNRAGGRRWPEEAGDLLSRLDRDARRPQRYRRRGRDLPTSRAVRSTSCGHRRRQAISMFWAHGPDDALPVLAAAEALADGLAGDEHGPRLVWERAMLAYDARPHPVGGRAPRTRRPSGSGAPPTGSGRSRRPARRSRPRSCRPSSCCADGRRRRRRGGRPAGAGRSAPTTPTRPDRPPADGGADRTGPRRRGRGRPGRVRTRRCRPRATPPDEAALTTRADVNDR